MRIQCVAQPVAEQVEAHHHDADGEARVDHELRRGDDESAPVVQHRPPLRRRRLRAETEERERGHREDEPAHLEAGQHDDRREDVRQQVSQQDAQVGDAGGARGIDVLPLARGEHEPAHDPRVVGPSHAHHADHHAADAGPEHADDRERQDERREREDDVDDAHDEVVDEAPVVARDEPDADANGEDEDGRERRGAKREARPPHDPREDVAPEVVRPKEGIRAGRQEPAGHVDRGRVGGRDDRRRDGDDGHHPDDDQPHDRGRVPEDGAEGARAAGVREPLLALIFVLEQELAPSGHRRDLRGGRADRGRRTADPRQG